MNPFDEDDEGDISIGESSAAEREMTPDIPKAPSVRTFDNDGDFSAAADVDQDTLRAFVLAVIYANAALLLVSLGPMVWYFEGWTRVGPALFVIGILAGIRTYQTYRGWERSRDERDADGNDEGGDTDLHDDAQGPDDDAGLHDDAQGPDDDTDLHDDAQGPDGGRDGEKTPIPER
ncbi:DUF7322 domain-containing protein [Halorubrum sp. DTA98]|uniref:DUF7322 domain-containing protein n=1 Tax=Halorubrum sp. DTA98 TaxID=3402163 RepID=UPI003AB09CE2